MVVMTPVESTAGEPQRDASFTAFYRRSYPDAKRLAHLLLNGSHDAEDVVQDAFAQLHRRFAGVENPGAYLRVAVINGAKQRFRSRDRERARLRLVAGGEPELPNEPDPLLDAVGALPYRQRAAVVLRYWSGLSDDEIAAAIGTRPATVRSLVHRAVTTLRKDFQE